MVSIRCDTWDPGSAVSVFRGQGVTQDQARNCGEQSAIFHQTDLPWGTPGKACQWEIRHTVAGGSRAQGRGHAGPPWTLSNYW